MTRRVGIDLSQGCMHTAVLVEGVKLLGKPFQFAATRAGIASLLERTGATRDAPLEFVLEPTGNVWPVISAALQEQGQVVLHIKTQKSADLRKFYQRHCKTDGVDSAAIARVPEVDPNGAHPVALPSAELHQLRREVKLRNRFVRNATTHKQRLHALMQLANPHLLAAVGSDKFCAASRLLIGEMLNPIAVVKSGREAFEGAVAQASRRQMGQKRVSALWAAYETTAELYEPIVKAGKLPVDFDRLQQEAKRELDALAFAEKQIEEIEVQIAELYRKVDPDQVLLQIPGLGPILAPTIEAFANPIARFANIGKFAKYCGVVPRNKQTGKGLHDRPGMPMTKAANSLLKRALRLAADVARKYDPEFAATYARCKAKGWHHERVLGLLAHKLARRIYALLKRRDLGTHEAQHYDLRTPSGEKIDRGEARRYVTEHYPSVRSQKSGKSTPTTASGDSIASAEGAACAGADASNPACTVARGKAGNGGPAAARTNSGPPSRDDAARRVRQLVADVASKLSVPTRPPGSNL